MYTGGTLGGTRRYQMIASLMIGVFTVTELLLAEMIDLKARCQTEQIQCPGWAAEIRWAPDIPRYHLSTTSHIEPTIITLRVSFSFCCLNKYIALHVML